MEECAHDPTEIDRNNKRPQRRAVPPQAGVNPGSGWGGSGLQHHQRSDAFKAVQETDPCPDRTLMSHPGLRDLNKT